MASDVLPDPDTPTTATIRHSGTSTSMSRRLLCRAPRTPMTTGRVSGTGKSAAAIPGTLRRDGMIANVVVERSLACPGRRTGRRSPDPGDAGSPARPPPWPHGPGTRPVHDPDQRAPRRHDAGRVPGDGAAVARRGN